jgi:subtilisin family serine protease
MRLTLPLRSSALLCSALLILLCELVGAPGAAAAGTLTSHAARAERVVVVGFRDEASLRAALQRFPGRVVHRIPALGAAEVRPRGSLSRFAARVSSRPGITYVRRLQARRPAVEPALLASAASVGAYEWQYAATRSNAVPAWALRAAAGVTIAVIDTGADLSAPDLASKGPATFDIRTGSSDVADFNGHGTFVSSLAAGSVSNGDGLAGFGGDAKLLVIRSSSPEGVISDVDAARAIVHAVEQGAKIVNLSFGGTTLSELERRAIDFAVARGVLVIAASGNAYLRGNPVIYPAALLQPDGSHGRGGRGLVVAASTGDGDHAPFSSAGSYVSLAAPGEEVFGALSSHAAESAYPRVPLPGSLAGIYGFGSGTSFAAPQVAGAAALVWGVNPRLAAADVAQILKETAQGGGSWTAELGYGVLDAAAAVARAAGTTDRADSTAVLRASHTRGRGPLRVRFNAALRSSRAGMALASREVVLESFDGRAWNALANGTTSATGDAGWRLTFRRGAYRLRTRYEGAGDLAAATSATVRVLVR